MPRYQVTIVADIPAVSQVWVDADSQELADVLVSESIDELGFQSPYLEDGEPDLIWSDAHDPRVIF